VYGGPIVLQAVAAKAEAKEAEAAAAWFAETLAGAKSSSSSSGSARQDRGIEAADSDNDRARDDDDGGDRGSSGNDGASIVGAGDRSSWALDAPFEAKRGGGWGLELTLDVAAIRHSGTHGGLPGGGPALGPGKYDLSASGTLTVDAFQIRRGGTQRRRGRTPHPAPRPPPQSCGGAARGRRGREGSAGSSGGVPGVPGGCSGRGRGRFLALARVDELAWLGVLGVGACSTVSKVTQASQLFRGSLGTCSCILLPLARVVAPASNFRALYVSPLRARTCGVEGWALT
jgi:hypothetical protein